LPLRIISIAIPLLFAFQIYQWVILNRGSRDIVNGAESKLLASSSPNFDE
jgi:hypothetical protein